MRAHWTRTVAAVAVAAAFVTAGAPEAHAGRPALVRVEADRDVLGPRVPRSFVGFSQEYNIVKSQVGDHVTGVNPVAVGLFDNITAFGSGAPVLRVGGGSTDGTTWNPTGRPRPRGIDFGIDYPLTIGLRNFLGATRSTAILGLNMGLNDPAVAVEEAQGFAASLPRRSIRALEIGNEPDFFDRRPFGTDADGKTVTARPKGYGVRRYLRELRRFSRALIRLRPRPRLAGPGLCCDPAWVRALPRIFRQERRTLHLATLHRYPLESCGAKPGQREYPTARTVLQPDIITGPAASLIPAVRAARRARMPLRLTETNSVACGGARGASDVFASALWAADWAYSLALIGAAGADFHGSSPLYQPFATGWQDGRFVGEARPLYYGLLLFAEGTSNNARLLPSTYYGARYRRGANVRVWGTYDARDRVVRVVVLNKDLRARGPAVVRVRGARGAGTVKRLEAPSVTSTTGVTYGGQSIAPATTDGRMVGSAVSTTIRGRRGTFSFDVRPGSAALLTVPVARRR